MGTFAKFALGIYIAVALFIWLFMPTFCSKNHSQPKSIINNQISIGYNLGKVGKDSVLTIKGQFVRQVGDRVMIKIR
jgi:hypothetical protein